MSNKRKSPREGPKTRKPTSIRKKNLSARKSFLLTRLLVNAFIWGSAIACTIILWYAHDLPDTARLSQSTRKAGVTLLARDGSILATYGDLYGQYTTLEDLPRHVPLAIMAIEDRRFYSHFGIDIVGVSRALWVNYRAGAIVQGGSTLTQQLAKNFLLSEGYYKPADRSLRRKMKELILALWLEAKFSKQQILTMYLNRVYLGSGAYGIDGASRKYFGKSARELSIYEAAVLAGLLKAPSRYSPVNNPELADERARVVLTNMLEAGFIKVSDMESLGKEQSRITSIHIQNTVGRYFSDWIFEQLNGRIGQVDQDIVVTTTLDKHLQSKAEHHLKNIILTEGFAADAHQGALISVTPDGAVRAMVGGIDYMKSQFNRAVQARRQIGSTFKMFVYLAALEKNYTPDTVISDRPLEIGNWSPRNYKWQSKGEVTLRTAMAFSLNTPVIRLTRQIGLKYIQGLAKRLGLTSEQPDNLTIALGAGEATLLELTAAYATIANHGFEVWPYGITSVRTTAGKVLFSKKKSSMKRLVEPDCVRLIRSMMQSVMTHGTGRKSALSRPCAGKSGTSQNYKDAWFVGFTPDIVTGVWMGNDDGKPMEGISGGKLPGHLWHDFMTDIHASLPVKDFYF